MWTHGVGKPGLPRRVPDLEDVYFVGLVAMAVAVSVHGLWRWLTG